MKNTLLTSFFILLIAAAYCQSNTSLKLWYNQPSGTTWEKALPIGNGRLGAMVYGNPGKEIIQLNESSVWTGSPNRNDNPDALAALPEIRKLVFEGKQMEAQLLAGKTMSSKINGMMYQPVGNLNLTFPGHEWRLLEFMLFRESLLGGFIILRPVIINLLECVGPVLTGWEGHGPLLGHLRIMEGNGFGEARDGDVLGGTIGNGCKPFARRLVVFFGP